MTSDTAGRDALSAYVAAQHHFGLEYGKHDCGAFVADWCEAVTGVHPWPELRGAYSDKDEIPPFLGDASLVQVMGRAARRNGYVKTRNPVRGDVGAFATGKVICLGICAGQSWLTKTTGIAVFKTVRVVAAWRIV